MHESWLNQEPLFKEGPAHQEPDPVTVESYPVSPWKILVVDDDEQVHSVTHLVLGNFEFEGKKIKILDAYSGTEAIEALQQHTDIALVLLDVVMESDTAGLDVAKRIRHELNNQNLRIVLRTGQPGQAPEQDVIVHYDINDYKDKTELTAQKLTTLIYSNLRSFRDILEVQKARKNLEEGKRHIFNLVNSMPSVIVGINAQYQVTDWNLAAAKATGQPADQVYGKSLSSVFPVPVDELMALIRRTLEHSETHHLPEIHIALQQGQYRHYAVTSYPLKMGDSTGAVIRFDDITGRFQLEKMMMQSEKMLTIGGLAAGMAHEIKNPLGVIVQSAQNLIYRLDPTEKKNQAIAASCQLDLERLQVYLNQRHILQYLGSIRVSVDRALDIISKMLRFGRNDPAELQPAYLPELVEEALGFVGNDYELKKTYDFKKTHIQRDYDPDLPPVPCARTEIIQVFLNLLKNAAQAMPQNPTRPPQICLALKNMGDRIQIVIEDNGTGMPADVLAHLFTPFFTTKKLGMGTGLGLSVCRFIITELHHGTIDVQSTLGNGTRFTIQLPTTAGQPLAAIHPSME